MKPSVKTDCVKAALSLGGFFGWYFSVMHLTEQNSIANDIFSRLKIGFYSGELFFLFASLILLIFFDIEKLITKKLVRHLPGVLIFAVTAIYFLSSATTLLLFVLVGIGSAVGAIAVLTSFLKVRTRYRMYVIGIGFFLGELIYLFVCELLPILSEALFMRYITVGALALIPLLTIKFEYFSVYSPNKVKRFNRKTVIYILKKKPFEFLLFVPLCVVYLFAYHSGDSFVSRQVMYNPSFNYELVSVVVFAISALAIGFLVKPHSAAGLFSSACALTASGTFFLSASVMTNTELAMFSLFGKIGYFCFLAGVFLFITAFSLDRLHPLLFSVAGYTAFSAGELLSAIAEAFTDDFASISIPVAVVLFILTPVSMFIISRVLAKHGYSAYAIERRRRIRRRISALAKEKELSGRESAVLELLIAEECSVEEIKYRLLVSSAALRRYLKGIEKRTGKSPSELKCELWDEDDENALNDF